MLNGLNSQLLKVMAEVNGIPLNPAVMGIGGALTTGAGIYKLMKDARRNNEQAIQEDTKFKEYQKFIPNAKLISYYSPWIKTLIRTPNPAIATVNLLAGLLSVQAKLLQHELTPVIKDTNILEKKKDDRSIGEMLKDSFFKLNYKLNPFAQLFTYIFQGLTPSAIAKLYGFDDKKDERKQRTEAIERETKYGISPRYAQLLGMTGAQLLRNGGRDSLLMGVFEMSKMISETLLIIKLKGFGIGKNVKIGEADERSSFLGRMLQGILNIPGVNAVKNVAKAGMNIALSPFKLYAKMGEIADKIPRAFKNFMSGGLYRAQDEETLMKKSGFKNIPFIQSDGLPNVLNSIDQAVRQTAEVLYTLTDAYLKKNNIIANLKDIYHSVKAKIYSKFTGSNVTKEEYANQRYEMYSRNFGGIMGNLQKLILGFKTRDKSAEVYQRLERQMIAKEFGKVMKERDLDKVRARMARPESRLAGESSVADVLGEEGFRKSHQTGQTRAIGAVGAVKTFGKFGLGLAGGLATGGIGGILAALLGPYFGIDSAISGIRTGRKEGWKKGVKAAFKGEDRVLGGGLIGSIISGSELEKKYRGSERGYIKSRLAREGDEPLGGSSTQTLQDITSSGPSEDILLLRDLNTKIENMHRGVSGISNLNATMTSLYKLIDTTINSVKTELSTLKNKAIELVKGFEKSFITPSSSTVKSLPASGNIIDILKFYAADSYKKTKRLTQVEEDELKELKKLSGFADSYSIAHAAASGGPATAKMKPESRIVPGKPPIDKKVDNVISINRNKTFQPLQSGEIIQTQDQFENYNKAISNIANSRDNLYILQNKYIEEFQQISSSNENVLKVLQDIRDNTKQDTTDTNRIIETIRNSQPDQEQRKLDKIEESSRWNKLIGLTEETKDTIRGKISYFLRDMWEETKFKKKKKEEDKPSGLFGLIGGLLGGAGGLLAKMFLGSKLINNPITRMFGSSLLLLVQDFLHILRFATKTVWKLVTAPIKKVGGWLVDRFKEYITTPIKNMFGKIGGYISEKFTKYAIEPMKHMFGNIGKFFKGEGTSFLSKMFGKIFGEHGILKSIGGFFKGEGTSFLSKMFGKIFTGEGGFLKKLFGKLFGEEGILKGLGKIFAKFSAGGLLKGILKRLPGINILFAGWDAFSAWKDAAAITGDPKPGFIKKLGAGVAGVLSGITFGLIEPKTIYGFISPAINWIGDSVSGIGDWLMNTKPVKMVKEFLGYTETDPNPEKSFLSRIWDKFKEISANVWDYMCDVPYIGVPLRLIRDTWNFLFESKKNAEGKFEPSFVSKMWTKLKDVTGDIFNYMKSLPIIGVPFRLLGDTYDFLFGPKDEKQSKSFIATMMDSIKSIGTDTFNYMKSIPIIGPYVRLTGDIYDYFFVPRNPNVEPTFIAKMFDGFKNIGDKYIEFMKQVPVFGMPFRIISDMYDFLYNIKPEDKQKSFFTRVIEFFNELTPDSIIRTILGPTWDTIKDVYYKITGSESDTNKQTPNIPPATTPPEPQSTTPKAPNTQDIGIDVDNIFGYPSTTPKTPPVVPVTGQTPNIPSRPSIESIDINEVKPVSTPNIPSRPSIESIDINEVKPVSTPTVPSVPPVVPITGQTPNIPSRPSIESIDINEVKPVSTPTVPSVPPSQDKQKKENQTPTAFKPFSEEELKKDTVKIGGFSVPTVVYKAIQTASDKYGIPLDYMLAKAAQESGFDPNTPTKVKNKQGKPSSSALGLYQFINKTWNEEMWKNVSPIPDRRDPYANADAAARYALKTKKLLGTDDPAFLYLGHFMGPGGAQKLYNALQKNPSTPAANVADPDQVAANSSIFKPGTTVKDIYNWSNNVIGGFMKKIGGRELPKLDTSDSPTSFKGSQDISKSSGGGGSIFDNLANWGKEKYNSFKESSVGQMANNAFDWGKEKINKLTSKSDGSGSSPETTPSTPPLPKLKVIKPQLDANGKFVPIKSKEDFLARYTNKKEIDESSDYSKSLSSPKENRSSQEVKPVGKLEIDKDVEELKQAKLLERTGTTKEQVKETKTEQSQQPNIINMQSPSQNISQGGQKGNRVDPKLDPVASFLISDIFDSSINFFIKQFGESFAYGTKSSVNQGMMV